MGYLHFPSMAALLFGLCVAVALIPEFAEGRTRHYTFNVHFPSLCASPISFFKAFLYVYICIRKMLLTLPESHYAL